MVLPIIFLKISFVAALPHWGASIRENELDLAGSLALRKLLWTNQKTSSIQLEGVRSTRGLGKLRLSKTHHQLKQATKDKNLDQACEALFEYLKFMNKKEHRKTIGFMFQFCPKQSRMSIHRKTLLNLR